MFRHAWRKIGIVSLVVLPFLALSFAVQLQVPEPTGSYPVGRTSHLWVDLSRPEGMTGSTEDFRQVPVQIWYPSEAGTGTKIKYFPGLERVATALAASGEVAAPEVFGLRFIRSHEHQEALLSAEADTYPVILLSPGGATNVEFYAAMADELASYGYIVVGVNHPYDVAAVALQDGSVAQFVEGPFALQARQPWVAERINVRTDDILFVLDQLEALNDSEESPFAGHLDLGRVGVMGHSLGGITAAQACLASSQIRACLNLDGLQQGGPFSVYANPEPPEQPFMLITKELQMHPAILALFEEGPVKSYRVVIPEATHENFSDGPLLLPSLLPLPNKADQILSLTRAYTLAFFEQALMERPSPILEQPTQNEEVVVEIYHLQ